MYVLCANSLSGKQALWGVKEGATPFTFYMDIHIYTFTIPPSPPERRGKGGLYYFYITYKKITYIEKEGKRREAKGGGGGERK